jgi:YD repeat-containing protein
VAADKESEASFIYDAFISYRHVERDRKWAEWLIDALERYRVPKALQERGVPPRLRKVFRDEDEVPASSDLNDQIKQALVASRFLIVVCSPYTPRSKWVEREIEMFNSLGRGDQVLALLTEGEPGDSFPNGMLVRERQVTDPDGSVRVVKEDKEPLAADVRPRKGQSADKLKRFALLRLVAVILGVKFDDLRQRDQERERSGKLKWAALAAVLCLMLGGLGFGYWELIAPTTKYYRQLVWRWGLPEGLGQLDDATWQHRVLSYAVTTRRPGLMAAPRVVEVRAQRSSGQLYPAGGSQHIDGDSRAHWTVSYREDGSVERVRGFDDADRLVRDDVLQHEPSSNRSIVTFERYGVPVAQDAAQKLGVDPLHPAQTNNITQRRAQIARQELTFDDNGFVIERRYQDAWGTPQHDAAGSFGGRFVNSPEGLILRLAEIGPDGAEVTLKDGIHAVALAYDKDYVLVRYALLGPDDKPIDGPNGYAYYAHQSDQWGNPVATSYFHPGGRPAVHKAGYAKFTVARDNHGDQVLLSYFGPDNEPVLVAEGFASFRNTNNERGNPIEEDYFGVDGKPTLVRGGFARAKFVRDARGRIVEQSYSDMDGTPTLCSDGYASLRRKFDARGNLIEEAYFGSDGKPILNKFGASRIEQSFDQHDNLVEQRVLGVDGKPARQKNGIAKLISTYDARGNLVRQSGFGVDGKLALANGVDAATVTQAYDDRGNLIEARFFGVDDKPMLSTAGIAGYRAAFDDRGNEIERTFLGLDGNPTLNNDHVATYRYKYDARGNIIEGTHYDTDGKPTVSRTGDETWRNVWNERGNRIELAYFGFDGKPMYNKEQVAKFKYAYDARGNEIERAFFGVDGQPILAPNGLAGFHRTFDARGNIVKSVGFGLDGNPTIDTTKTAGWLKQFDARSHLIELTYFGVDGKPALFQAGYAGYRQEFDAHGNLVERTFLGTDGKPIEVPGSGLASVSWTYDTRDYLTEESYFGIDGQPASSSGCVRITYSYDDTGKQTGVTYWDAQGHPMQIDIAVTQVIPGMAGERSGLTAKDVILTYAGRKVDSIAKFDDLIAEAGADYRIMTVRRGSETLSFSVPQGILGITLMLVRADTQQAVVPVAPQAN